MAKRRAKAPKEAPLLGPTQSMQEKVVPVLQGYLDEAKQARLGGLNSRDMKWEENLHLYWNRYDMSRKADWQAREVMPEVPTFVDRFASALKEALVASADSFYDIVDPADQEGDITDAIKRMTDVWLSTCGRNQSGTPLGFPAVFEEQIKLGALMACSSSVIWRDDHKEGRVCIETDDPRMIWLDPTYRNLYRIRRKELDKHELVRMATAKDAKGRSLWNIEAITQMMAHIEGEDRRKRDELTGHGSETSSTRQPITMDEYIATVVDNQGKIIADNALMVVGNGQFLIRGPEKNPFWHGKDWHVYAPLVHTPLSVYGRTYMEDFGSVAKTFNNLTNMILDAVYTSSLKAFAVVPSMLTNPGQLASGITPNKMFMLEDGSRPEDFMKAIELGTLPAESVTVWNAIKQELREAADMNEVGLGQFAPKGRTSATEVTQTQESSSAMIRSMAQTVETRYLNPTLDLVWKTGLQHVRPTDKVLAAAAGEEMFRALHSQRKELVSRPITFQARGISTLIQKNKMLRSLLMLMQVLSQSDPLLAEFLKVADMGKLLRLLFELSDIDLRKIEPTQRERMMSQFQNQMQPAMQAAAGAQPASPEGAAGVQQAVQQLGIAR